jgi:ABC-2 type transport system ATP-binding protein
VLANGRVAADATPDELRTLGGKSVIRYRIPAGAPDLPPALLRHVSDHTLALPSADLTTDLAMLVEWARAHDVDLTGLEVGPPSLEDAYFTVTGTASREEMVSHG